jgi:hypothetical protein
MISCEVFPVKEVCSDGVLDNGVSETASKKSHLPMQELAGFLFS